MKKASGLLPIIPLSGASRFRRSPETSPVEDKHAAAFGHAVGDTVAHDAEESFRREIADKDRVQTVIVALANDVCQRVAFPFGFVALADFVNHQQAPVRQIVKHGALRFLRAGLVAAFEASEHESGSPVSRIAPLSADVQARHGCQLRFARAASADESQGDASAAQVCFDTLPVFAPAGAFGLLLSGALRLRPLHQPCGKSGALESLHNKPPTILTLQSIPTFRLSDFAPANAAKLCVVAHGDFAR